MPDKGTRNKIAGYITRLKRASNVPKPRQNQEKNQSDDNMAEKIRKELSKQNLQALLFQ